MSKKDKMKRAYAAIQAAKNSTNKIEVRNKLAYITLHSEGYAEPGYEGDIIALGDWNVVDRYDSELKERVLVSNIPRRLEKVLRRIGIDTIWSDEWLECNGCGRLVRSQPDNWYWKPSYVRNGSFCDGLYCNDCIEELKGKMMA